VYLENYDAEKDDQPINDDRMSTSTPVASLAPGNASINGIDAPSSSNKGGRPKGVKRKSLDEYKGRAKQRLSKRAYRKRKDDNLTDLQKFNKLEKLPNFAKVVVEKKFLHMVKELDIGDLTEKCKFENCGALHFPGEQIRREKGEYNECCNMGKKYDFNIILKLLAI